MQCASCLRVFQTISQAFTSTLDTVSLLEVVAKSVVEELELKSCQFRLLSRDQRILEHVASHGVSQAYLDKGPVDAERSVTEALQGRTVFVADCATDPRIQYPAETTREGIVSVLTVPLRTRGQVIGVMRLGTCQRREFSPEELQIIEVVAGFCTSAVNHSMFQEILRHVTQSIRTSLDLQEVLSAIVRIIAEDLRARGAFIQMAEVGGARLRVRAAFGLGEAFLERIEGEPGPAAFRALEGEGVAILDAREGDGVPWREEAVQERFASLLYVPLMVRDQALGVLCVATHHPYRFSEAEINLMTAIGEQCALAIRTAQMYGSMKRRYETVVEDFHQWFEHFHVFPHHGAGE